MIIVDIDGTLADCRHRLHHVTVERNWNAFFKDMADDVPHWPIVELVRSLNHHKIILCSGRPEEYREVTEAWLWKYEIPFDRLYMRTTGDYRADYVVKRELYQHIKASYGVPDFVVDDRDQVIEGAWLEEGLFVLQVRLGQYAHEMNPDVILTMMVGPSGSGKSTWLRSQEAKEEFGIHESHIISSDQLRQDLAGDFRSQERNNEVFSVLHSVVQNRLRNNLPTAVDATHIKTKNRVDMAKLSQGVCKVRYIVINRPMKDKIRDAGWRSEVQIGSLSLLQKHENTFQSNLKAILNGDNLTNVQVYDRRTSSN